MNNEENIYDLSLELENIIENIINLKNETLDHFHEDKKTATALMLDLNELEQEAKNLIQEFSF
jgi:hypothetical protein